MIVWLKLGLTWGDCCGCCCFVWDCFCWSRFSLSASPKTDHKTNSPAKLYAVYLRNLLAFFLPCWVFWTFLCSVVWYSLLFFLSWLYSGGKEPKQIKIDCKIANLTAKFLPAFKASSLFVHPSSIFKHFFCVHVKHPFLVNKNQQTILQTAPTKI